MKVFAFFSVILFTLHSSNSQRRIVNGVDINTPKRYMAYLVRAPKSSKQYDAWMCGGAIISRLLIVTSAACVEDIEFMYAIAGYDQYVPAAQLDKNECTSHAKKKVVFTCVPQTYELDLEKVEKWSHVDIALVKVESPFDFESTTPHPYCSWVPDQIEISFETKHRMPNVDVMVLGWGHAKEWRKPSDTTDHNQKKLQYSPTLILDKKVCKNSYSAVPDLLTVIDKYMICTLGEGNIDADGQIINRLPGSLDGCGQFSLDPNCNPSGGVGSPFGSYFYRRYFPNPLNNQYPAPPVPPYNIMNGTDVRNGICQNDHGGPLVTWVGKREVLIGIASVFLVDVKDRSCVGPYLHTSTQCNGAFLACVIGMFPDDLDKSGKPDDEARRSYQTKDNTTNANDTRRIYGTPQQVRERQYRYDIDQRYKYMVMMNKKICQMPATERGFDIIQRRISWLHHPDGPAENELADELIERPQIPLNSFNTYGTGLF